MANSKCRWVCPEQWSQWSEWLAAGLHARNRWRLPVLMAGILFANGRRTVTTWLRAAGVSDDYQDYYDARCGRSALFVRPYLGHDFARRAASPVGSGGIAAASDALRSQANDGDDTQMRAMASLCDQASVGSAIGRMGRSHPEKSWGNGLVIVLPSNRTFMTSRKFGAVANNRCATSGRTLPSTT